jgi:hypothetical protein
VTVDIKAKKSNVARNANMKKLAKIHVNTDMMEIVKQEIRF